MFTIGRGETSNGRSAKMISPSGISRVANAAENALAHRRSRFYDIRFGVSGGVGDGLWVTWGVEDFFAWLGRGRATRCARLDREVPQRRGREQWSRITSKLGNRRSCSRRNRVLRTRLGCSSLAALWDGLGIVYYFSLWRGKRTCIFHFAIR